MLKFIQINYKQIAEPEEAEQKLNLFDFCTINEGVTGEETSYNDNSWICRFKLTEDGTSLEVLNKETESILLKHEVIFFILEYAKNKLFMTVQHTWMFLIDNWATIRCIQDPDSQNMQYYAFMVPQFDEEKFPFIAVCGL